jgi:type III secretion protein N (ATPase)
VSDADRAKLRSYLQRLDEVRPATLVGRVVSVTGLVIRATAAGARVGDLVEIAAGDHTVRAEVVGMDDDIVALLPYGDTRGIGPDSDVRLTGGPLEIQVGGSLLGRVLDGLGNPLDGRPLDGDDLESWAVMRPPPAPLTRKRIDKQLCMGVRAIDGLLTIGEGQRMGLFAGSGVGKSSLMGQIARGSSADVVVICLVGERGREVREFIEDTLGTEGLARSVVVAATSDEPPMIRLKCAYTATAVAEYFRESGRRVLLMMDSVTRFARAQRDVSLAAGELPARHGYPPSVFAALPQLLERSGNSTSGTMTALYTVLVAGDDLQEPIADEVRGVLDGHIVLDRRLAERAHWPAIDVLQSLSRLMSHLASKPHIAAAEAFRRLLSVYESKRDLIALGAYKLGSDPDVDEAIDMLDDLDGYLQQGIDEHCDYETAVSQLLELTGD